MQVLLSSRQNYPYMWPDTCMDGQTWWDILFKKLRYTTRFGTTLEPGIKHNVFLFFQGTIYKLYQNIIITYEFMWYNFWYCFIHTRCFSYCYLMVTSPHRLYMSLIDHPVCTGFSGELKWWYEKVYNQRNNLLHTLYFIDENIMHLVT